jgi:hypothetical protein
MKKPGLSTAIVLGAGIGGGIVAAMLPVLAMVLSLAGFAAVAQVATTFFAAKKRAKK